MIEVKDGHGNNVGAVHEERLAKLERVAKAIADTWRDGLIRDLNEECFFCTATEDHDDHKGCPVGLALELYPEDT